MKIIRLLQLFYKLNITWMKEYGRLKEIKNKKMKNEENPLRIFHKLN
jgi:hypothetical protein